MNTKFEWTKITHDSNGNPRYVMHFLDFVPDIKYGIDSPAYEIAVKRANKLGGRKFHNKQYGGGIVFQSYNIYDLEKKIIALIERIK